jgi:hypothetical protein
MMKKILSIITLLGLGTAAMAQDIKVGPEIGATYNTMWQTIGDKKYSTNYQLGFKVGAVADFKFNENFSLQPGLFVSINNGTESNNETFYKTESGVPRSITDHRNYDATYLQMPIYALFKIGKEYDDPHFFIGVGPSFNMGIGGTFKQEYSDFQNGVGIPTRYDNSMPYGNSRTQDQMRRFDVSANATLGYELPIGVYIRASYGIGLLNLAPGGSDYGNSLRNSGFGLSVGWFFNAKESSHWQ